MSCHDEDARPDATAKIRALNDQLRRTMPHGRVLLTRAVADLDPATVLAIIKAVKAFDNFTPQNDRYFEHDFGKVEVEETEYFWKCDAYDLNMEWGSPDPADDAVTKRIITIMTAQDL